MKIVAIKSNLKRATSIVEKIAGENPNLPILKNILIEADSNKIKTVTTNLEIAITCLVPGKIIEAGKITVPASIISGIINNLQSERISLEKKGNKLEIKTDTYEAVVEGNSADDFPITPKIENKSEFIEIKSSILKESFKQVLLATQFSDLRPELNSVFFNFLVDDIKIAATDSFRLAEKIILKDRFNTNYKKEFKALLPFKAINEVLRVFGDDDIVKIYTDDNQILFKSENVELLSRLLEGNFPDYEAIIPKKFSFELQINRDEFFSGLKLVGVIGSKNNEVKFKTKDGKKLLEIVSSEKSLGENKCMLLAKTNGKSGEISFNWRYVMDGLKAMDSEEIFFGINSESEPAEIKPVGDSSYLYVLKPISGA